MFKRVRLPLVLTLVQAQNTYYSKTYKKGGLILFLEKNLRAYMNSRVHVLSPVLFVLLCSCQAKKPPRESPLRSKPADLSFEWFVEKALFLGLAHHSLAVYRTRKGEGLGGAPYS